MKYKRTYCGIFLFLVLAFLLEGNIFIKEGKSTSYDNGTLNFEGIIEPDDPSIINFNISGSKIEILSDVQVNLTISFTPFVFSRQISIIINNSDPIDLKIECFLDLKAFLGDLFQQLPNQPTMEDIKLLYNYNCYYRMTSNSSIDQMTLKFNVTKDRGLDPSKQYTLTAFMQGESAWRVIPTEEKSTESSSVKYLESSVTDFNSSEPYYFTIYEKTSITIPIQINWSLVLNITALIALIFTALVIVISKQDYIRYLKNRNISLEKNKHHLTLEEVLENENRNIILDLILKEPGIHFNELLRKTEISAGNLVWHLDVLLSYKIIGKKRFEHYIIYFPYYLENPLSNMDLKLQKSELSLKLLKMIEKNPGIYNTQIAKQLSINRKTIQYHIQKLIDLELIIKEKIGRKNHLYIKTDKSYI